MNPDVTARGLGWFSVGLGVTELVAAERLAESLGMEGKEDLIRLYGAREVATGLGCLGQTPPTPWVWGRVAGDALDIATLLAHMTPDNPKRHNVGLALAAVIGVTLLDVLTAAWLTEDRHGPLTRMARRPLERLEQRNERRMREVERRGGQYASELAAEAGR
ncbi:MAG TPA: hypothetical protein VF170_09895 [Planctomycetaceae bacterium]